MDVSDDVSMLSLGDDGDGTNVLLMMARWHCTTAGEALCTPLSAADLVALASTCKSLCSFSKAWPQYWAHLSLSACPRFLEEGTAAAARFRGVKSLDLQFCNALRDTHLVREALPPALCRLNLDACHAVTDKGVKSFADACGKHIAALSLYWNTRITDSAALSIALRCGPTLTSLCLSGCQHITSTGVLSLASRCRNLVMLDLTRMPRVDDTALGAIIQANAGLCELYLFASSQYSDAPLLTLAARCSNLRHLDCTGLRRLTDTAICAIASNCRELRTLILSWVVELTDRAVIALSQGCPLLATLSLHGIKGVSDVGLAALAQHLSKTMAALDVRGCILLQDGDYWAEGLRAAFPKLQSTIIHKG